MPRPRSDASGTILLVDDEEMVRSSVTAMLSDLGFLDFVIRHEKGNDRRFLDVIWTIRLGQSGLQTVAMLVCAWPIALFLGNPELALPIAAAAPLFLLSALCPMTLLLAQREGRMISLERFVELVRFRPNEGYALQRVTSETLTDGELLARFGDFALRRVES